MNGAQAPLGQLQTIAQIQEVEALAISLDDQPRLGRVSVLMLQQLWRIGEYERAVTAGQRSLAIGEALGDPMLRAMASFHQGQANYALGNYARAGELFAHSMGSLSMGADYEISGLAAGFQAAGSRAWWATCLAEQGEFAVATARADEALRIAEAAEHPFTLSVVLWALGRLHLLRGDWEQVIRVEERGLELCRAWDIGLLFSVTATTLGVAYAQAGRVAEAISLLEQAVAGAVRGRFHARALSLISLGEVNLSAGRREDARACTDEALRLAQAHHERGNEAWAQRLLAEIAGAADPPEVGRAEACYCQALALAKELGMRPLVAHCHLGVSTLYQNIGRSEEARAELAIAADMYREMEMTFWLERAERELA